jgi:hypothetical protein
MCRPPVPSAVLVDIVVDTISSCNLECAGQQESFSGAMVMQRKGSLPATFAQTLSGHYLPNPRSGWFAWLTN